MSEKKLFLGDGGTIQAAAQAAYEAAFAAAQAAYDAVMCDAPQPAMWAKPSAERAEFVARAEAGFWAIEEPARAKRDAAWIPGPRPDDYSIGLGESED